MKFRSEINGMNLVAVTLDMLYCEKCEAFPSIKENKRRCAIPLSREIHRR